MYEGGGHNRNPSSKSNRGNSTSKQLFKGKTEDSFNKGGNKKNGGSSKNRKQNTKKLDEFERYLANKNGQNKENSKPSEE